MLGLVILIWTFFNSLVSETVLDGVHIQLCYITAFIILSASFLASWLCEISKTNKNNGKALEDIKLLLQDMITEDEE